LEKMDPRFRGDDGDRAADYGDRIVISQDI
jgi:hypothetical protein